MDQTGSKKQQPGPWQVGLFRALTMTPILVIVQKQTWQNITYLNRMSFFITCQHAACRPRYCYGKSECLFVCLSVTLQYCIKMNAHTVKLFPPSGTGKTHFWVLPPSHNSKGSFLSRGINALPDIINDLYRSQQDSTTDWKSSALPTEP